MRMCLAQAVCRAGRCREQVACDARVVAVKGKGAWRAAFGVARVLSQKIGKEFVAAQRVAQQRSKCLRAAHVLAGRSRGGGGKAKQKKASGGSGGSGGGGGGGGRGGKGSGGGSGRGGGRASGASGGGGGGGAGALRQSTIPLVVLPKQ